MILLLSGSSPQIAAQTQFYPASPGSILPPPSPGSSPQQSVSSTQLQVWNESSKYPATEFRSEVTPPMFALWPENLTYVKFVYFCEDTSNHTRKLAQFVYKEGQGILVSRPYFDVGLVDKHFTPFFRHWSFWQVDIRRITCPLECEYSDLQRLYVYRLKRKVLATGLGYGVALLAILQAAVIMSDVLVSILIPVARNDPKNDSGTFSLRSWRWSDCISDWIHLLLLVMIGFAMMEGVGHSNYFRWRSMLLYNTAVSYSWLTLFALISSFLHQSAHILVRRSSNDNIHGARVVRRLEVPACVRAMWSAGAHGHLPDGRGR